MLAVMTEDRASTHRRLGRWLYAGGRPNRLARALNRLSVLQVGAGLLPARVVTLEVPGRVSGRTVSFPLVAVEQDGATYLVAMLGHRTNWVRNVAANGGRAVLRRRRGGPVDVELRRWTRRTGRRSCGASSRWRPARARTSRSTGTRRSPSSRGSRRTTPCSR